MLPVNNHLTPIVGIDTHFTTLPPFNPFHPFIGMVMDPMDYIPFIGATVYVNKIPRGVSDTAGMLVTYMHIPLFTPPWAMAPIIGHESVNFFASTTVSADGTKLSPKGYMVMSCNDIGIPLSLSPGKKKFWKVVPTLFAPTSFSLPIPTGSPVIVGAPYAPDIMGALMGLAMGFGLGCLGKFGKWVGKKAAKKFNKSLKKAIGPNKLSDFLCKKGLEPVNLITGAVIYDGTDFNLPGLVPIDWKRSWYSDSAYEGWLGHGVHSVLDRCVEVYKEEQAVGLRMQDGRVVAFPMLDYGEEFYLRQEKITLKRTGKGNYEAFEHATSLTYKFESYNGYNKYRMTAIENPAQKGIKLHVNGDRLMGITDSVGRELLVETDGAGRIVEIKLETEAIHQTLIGYKYDAKGNMTHIIDALGQATVMEHDDHLMVKKTDRNGQAFYWEYDAKDETAKCIHTWGDGGYQEGWLEYHTEEGYNLMTDANGAVTTYYYTSEGLVTQVKDPLGNSEFTEYTEFMEIYRQIDAEGNLTGFTYDGNGNMTGVVYPDGSQEQSMYDEQDRLIVTSDAEGNKRTFGYVEEKPHLLESIIEPNNSVTVFEYDENDLLVEVRQNGQKSKLFYDDKYNLVAFQDAQKHTTTWSYDDKGQVRAVKASEQSNQIFNYDALGRVTRITGADHNTTKLVYNAYDEVIEAIDKHHHVKFAYTPLGSLQMREENGKKVFFDYDKMEQLLRIENEKNEKYTFSRNIKGDIIEEKGFDGLTRRYKRDNVGKVIKVNRPAKRWSEYEYDSVGKISRVEHYDGSFESFSYNKNGQVVEARTEKNAIFIERDSMGRVSKETQSTGLVEDEGYEVLSTYNKNGQRTKITSSLGAAIENSYDNLGRRIHTKASLEQEESEETKNWEAKLKHNALGQEIERSLTGGITSSFAYDEAGRPISHKVKRGFHDNRNYNYTWDANHRLKETINAISQGKVEYAYDAFGNLASAKYENGSYDYKLPDEVGNLYKEKTKSEQVYGKGGKLLKDKDWYFQYDEEGNLVRKTKEVIPLEKEMKNILSPSRFWVEENKPSKADYIAAQTKVVVSPKWKHGDWFYNWQGNGMLESVKRPDGTEIRFEYDALGRRTAKINEATKEITRFVWDGNVPLHEWKYNLSDRPQIVANELGELSLDKSEPRENLITWIFDEGSFVPSAKITKDDTFSIVYDYIGKPIAAYNGVGNLVWDVEYDIFGNIRSQSKGDKDFIPFRNQGQYEDSELNGLMYNRFRYYDGNSGTYISQDPIKLRGSNPNFYAYTKDSNSSVDVFGLSTVIPDVLIHYTDKAGLDKILSEGVIRSNSKGKTYLTDILFTPKDVETNIFLGNTKYVGKGDYAIIFKVTETQKANTVLSSDIFEYIHKGDFKISEILYSGTNPYASSEKLSYEERLKLTHSQLESRVKCNK